RIAVARALVERPAEVRAGRGDRADGVAARPGDEDGGAFDLDAAQRVALHLGIVENPDELGRAALPGGPVDADAEPEAELSPDVGGRGARDEAEQGSRLARGAVALRAEDERGHVQQQ